VESPEINSHICQIIITNRAKTIQQAKASLSTNGAGKAGYPYAKKKKKAESLPNTIYKN
jgi:hypothetical protein